MPSWTQSFLYLEPFWAFIMLSWDHLYFQLWHVMSIIKHTVPPRTTLKWLMRSQCICNLQVWFSEIPASGNKKDYKGKPVARSMRSCVTYENRTSKQIKFTQVGFVPTTFCHSGYGCTEWMQASWYDNWRSWQNGGNCQIETQNLHRYQGFQAEFVA